VSAAAGLPPVDHAARRERTRALLATHDVDVLLVTRPHDVRYLTGFTGSNATVLLGGDAGVDVLVTDARYRERVGDLDLAHVELERRLPAVLAALPTGTRLAFDAEHVTVGGARRLADGLGDVARLVELASPLAGPRSVKDEAEIARIARACAITSEALEWVAGSVLRPGLRQLDIARALEARFLQLGADGVAFPTIVASGVDGASPHHETGERPLAAGELVTIDCGAEVDGYRADMTRTVPSEPGSSPAGQLVEVHEVVVMANEAGRNAALTDGAASAVDEAARTVVEEAGYGAAFVHPTGHGIGLDVHEAPLVVAGATASLPLGTTFTVEPGIYLSGLGGVRIEDSLVAGPDGCVALTPMERRLVGA
jgi:Xaa-Pro aminopeptidase